MTPNEVADAAHTLQQAQAAQAGAPWEPYIAPFFGLLGVAVGGILQWALAASTARQARTNQLADEAAREKRERRLASLALAEHLEDFVFASVDIVSSQAHVYWATPYDVAEHSEVPVWLQMIPPWPDLVDWRHVGFGAAVRATNFRRQVAFDLDYLRSASDHLDGEDLHSEHANLAAKRGIEAWQMAADIRAEAELEPLIWPQNATGLDILRRRLRDLQTKETGASDAMPSDPAAPGVAPPPISLVRDTAAPHRRGTVREAA